MRCLQCALLAGVAAIGITSIASAADMQAKAPVYKAPIAAAYNWTGFYVGGNAGYGWKNQTASFSSTDDPATGLATSLTGVGPPATFNMHGALGGLQIGYNWQFNRNWVAGLEADFDFASIKGDGTANYLSTGGALPYSATVSEKVKWFGTVRARLGYLPTSNLFVYGTGGLAYGKVEQNASHANNSGIAFLALNGFCPATGTCWIGTSSRTRAGWTAGGGAEYAFMNNWSVKAEYLYVNLGSNSFIETLANASGTSSITASFKTQFHVVRAGLNYLF